MEGQLKIRRIASRTKTAALRYSYALRSEPSAWSLLHGALDGASPERFVTHMRSRTVPRFFIDPVSAVHNAAQLSSTVPRWRETTLRDADRIANGVVRILGADAVSIVESDAGATGARRVRWHGDIIAGYEWSPAAFYKDIEIPHGVADIKVPWEISRCQHLPVLGMAYAIWGDDRYAEEIVAQIRDWIGQNKPGYGANWSCAMEVAIRAVNWLWAFHFIRQASPLDDAFAVEFLASLVSHARHIHRNIETYAGGVTTNHTLADYLGLYYLGTMLPEFSEAGTWLRTGQAGLEACMKSQVTSDGADFENSLAYHRLVLEMFVGAYLLGHLNHNSFSRAFARGLERMIEFVGAYTRPDGLAPLIGDSDDGRLQILSRYFDWDPRDHRYLLALGAELFDRDDFAGQAAGGPGGIEEVTWLLGRQPRQLLRDHELHRPAPSPATSRAFPSSGRYILRHGDHHVVVCADEPGTGGLANHKHNDMFSFELTVAGVPIVVDGGSFAYTGDPPSRDRFRSTAAHSTIVIDGLEQNEPLGPFALRVDSHVEVHQWLTTAVVDYLDMSHTGYERVGVRHRRQFTFIKEPFMWLVLDTLVGRGRHTLDSYIHLAPGGDLESGGPDSRVRYSTRGISVEILSLGPLRLSVCSGLYSARYGKQQPRPVLRFSGTFCDSVSCGYAITGV